ncbi:MAG: hypothetical protein EA394_01765 [Bacteroidia bacterium]|nr:MAG: hypothetical protein EA394_01765 [Bacteroidia bacterium]
MIRLVFLLYILLAYNTAFTQSIVIAEDLRDEPEREFGMNRKHYTHTWVGLHFLIGPPETEAAEVLYGRSRSLEFGYRYKRRFSDVFSAGSEWVFRRSAFHIRQHMGKEVPDTIIHDKEKLIFLQGGAGLYQRVNFAQRGDYIGRFADIGAYGAWNFHVRQVTHDVTDNGERVRTRRTRMDYPATFEYGIMARLGFNNIVLKGNYRVSDLFAGSADLPELPRWSAGLEFGLHPY